MVAGGGQGHLLFILVLLLGFLCPEIDGYQGDLLSCLMFVGRSRRCGKSLDTRGELLFVLALIS